MATENKKKEKHNWRQDVQTDEKFYSYCNALLKLMLELEMVLDCPLQRIIIYKPLNWMITGQ